MQERLLTGKTEGFFFSKISAEMDVKQDLACKESANHNIIILKHEWQNFRNLMFGGEILKVPKKSMAKYEIFCK